MFSSLLGLLASIRWYVRRVFAEASESAHASDRRKNLMELVSQFKSAHTLKDDEGLVISPLLLAMQQYFEKYEGHMYW